MRVPKSVIIAERGRRSGIERLFANGRTAQKWRNVLGAHLDLHTDAVVHSMFALDADQARARGEYELELARNVGKALGGGVACRVKALATTAASLGQPYDGQY